MSDMNTLFLLHKAVSVASDHESGFCPPRHACRRGCTPLAWLAVCVALSVAACLGAVAGMHDRAGSQDAHTTSVVRSVPLPPGFTVQRADGTVYVCSDSPVMCTGNRP